MGHPAPGYLEGYQKGADKPQFSTLGGGIKEASWGDTCNIIILGQEETLESV